MFIKENRTTYHCEHCPKMLFSKSAMIKHEDTCNSNPKNNKACFGCKYLTKTEQDIWFENRWGGEGDYKKVFVFKCTKLDKLMYPYSIEKKDLPNKYPETYEDQEVMPNNCEEFQEDNLPF